MAIPKNSLSNHPINLTVRFLLELAALGGIGYWGYAQFEGVPQVLLCVGLPIIAATLWGVFRVNGDPKDAPVPVKGFVRLGLEFAFFAAAVILLAVANQPILALILGGITLVHYIVSVDRVRWLLAQ